MARSRRFMAVESRMLLLLIVLLNLTGNCDHYKFSHADIRYVEVSCSTQEICALRESSVDLTCSYSHINITTGFWFSVKDKVKWWKEDHPEDLALDSDYAGRVRYTEMSNFSSTLTITDLRERDSGEYRLMIITDKGEKYQSSAGVTLTVTDLQVIHNSTRQTLSCSTSCSLTSALQQYHWYSNGKPLQDYRDYTINFPLKNAEGDSYSCSAHLYNFYSPPLCVGINCWNMTYVTKRVCTLEGSSVEFAGSYSHPNNLNVDKVFWHHIQDNQFTQDLKLRAQFANQVEYMHQNRTIKINQLFKNVSEEYLLRFIANSTGFSGRPGVVLNVTDLQVKVSQYSVESEGQTTVTLSCITSCTLSNKPTYMWYKNGQNVTNKLTKHNKLYLNSCEDAGNYSCSVRGREDLRSPEETVTCFLGNNTPLMHVTVGLIALLALILFSGALCMWKRKSCSANRHSSGVKKQRHSASGISGKVAADDQDNVQYASIVIKRSHTREGSPSPPDTTEQDDVMYSAVNVSRSTRLVADEVDDDPSQLYSKIQKIYCTAE